MLSESCKQKQQFSPFVVLLFIVMVRAVMLALKSEEYSMQTSELKKDFKSQNQTKLTNWQCR